MPHQGEHPLLGSFKVNLDSSRKTPGEIKGSVDSATGQPLIDSSHPAEGYFDVYFQVGHLRKRQCQQRPTFVGPETPLYKALYLGGGGAAGTTTTSYAYIHSKVAIIDDKYAVIGSANFNPRSMSVDGELDAFITWDSVKGFRKKLWDEWFPGHSVEPATWESRVSTNEGGILTAGRHWVLSIRPGEYAKGAPNRSGMAAIFDEANRW
jgi:phosphatidylserine/phosphatidylglycerophosphate/cardiolipin synthase-like enzyme